MHCTKLEASRLTSALLHIFRNLASSSTVINKLWLACLATKVMIVYSFIIALGWKMEKLDWKVWWTRSKLDINFAFSPNNKQLAFVRWKSKKENVSRKFSAIDEKARRREKTMWICLYFINKSSKMQKCSLINNKLFSAFTIFACQIF